MRRLFFALVSLAIVAIAIYWFALRGSSTPTAEARPSQPVAQIGEGKGAIVVGDDGRLMGTVGAKPKTHLVVLRLKQPPQGRRVKGHALEEVHIIAAAPKALRRYMAKTAYGETGVNIELISGIEIRFGDEREAPRKWKAAAAVLADPAVVLLSYVDVSAPSHPVVWGEGHELPPAS